MSIETPDTSDETGAAAQLDNEETLDGPLDGDPLDAGYSPPDGPTAVESWGTTEREAAEGESLDLKLDAEEPDPADEV